MATTGSRARGALRRIALPLGLMVATAVYLAKAFETTSPYGTEVVSVRFFPILVAITLLVALAVVAVQELRRGAPADEAAEASGPTPWRVRLAPVVIVALTALYVAVFVPLGYLVATGLYVFALLHVFGYQDVGWLRRIAAAAAITAVGWVLFAQIFNVRLPVFPGLG